MKENIRKIIKMRELILEKIYVIVGYLEKYIEEFYEIFNNKVKAYPKVHKLILNIKEYYMWHLGMLLSCSLFYKQNLDEKGNVIYQEWLWEAKKKKDIKWKIFLNIWGILKEINVEFIVKVMIYIIIIKVLGYWDAGLFIRFIYILLFVVLYGYFLRWPIKNGNYGKKKIKEIFKKYKYINNVGLYLYKWSHFYFWWVEIKVIVINILRVLRYLGIKYNLEGYINVFDKILFLSIIIIEKIFFIIILFWNELKKKLHNKKIKELIFWRIRILIFITILLYMFNLDYVIMVIFFIILIKVIDSIIVELAQYFLIVYNIYDNILFDVTSTQKGFVRPYMLKVSNIYHIFFYRFYFKNLDEGNVLEVQDVYSLQLKIDVNYLDSMYLLSNGAYYIKYCVISKENMYWYDNSLFFKDVMGGLKLVYIMNYIYMLKDLIGKVVWYDFYIMEKKGFVPRSVSKVIINYRELLPEFGKFWELINREEINNGQKFKININFIVDMMGTFGSSGYNWFKLYLDVENKGIKSIKNKVGNEIMLEEFKKLRERMIKIVNMENELVSKDIIKNDQVFKKKIGEFLEFPISKEDAYEFWDIEEVKDMTEEECDAYIIREFLMRYEHMVLDVLHLALKDVVIIKKNIKVYPRDIEKDFIDF